MYRNVCWTHRDTHGDRRQLQHEILHVCQREQQQQHAPHRSSQLSQIARCTTSLPWLHANSHFSNTSLRTSSADSSSSSRLPAKKRRSQSSGGINTPRRERCDTCTRVLMNIENTNAYQSNNEKHKKKDDDDGLLTSKVQTRIDGDERSTTGFVWSWVLTRSYQIGRFRADLSRSSPIWSVLSRSEST